jgi:predicted ribosome quality control (RQC) complex YloA/Tae2 family protein
MYFDALTIAALVDEFMDQLVGGRVQDALDVGEDALGLEIYAHHRRQYLYFSADHLKPRVHIVPDKLRRGTEKPSTLLLLFRRYVEKAIVAHVSQPEWERVLIIDLEHPDGEFSIIVEPMERRSNLLLVQNGTVIDCARRVGASDNRVRVSLPNHPYVPPPPQTSRRDPYQVTADEVEAFFAPNDDPKRKAFQVLSGNLLGVSPLLAKEIIYRAHGDATLPAAEADPDAVFAQLEALMLPLKAREWQPGIVEQDGRVDAFSVYPITHLDGWQRVDSISDALNAYYGAPVGDEAYDNAKKPVFESIDEASAKLGAKLASLQRSMTDDAEREVLRQSGELILAYQYTIHKGQTELSAHYDPDLPPLTIKIDPTLTPLENAQAYFSRYNKAKRALDDVPRLIKETQSELDYVRQLATDLRHAANWSEIDEVQGALQARGHLKGKSVRRLGSSGQSAPLRLISGDQFVVWVGRNSRQNELVTFRRGSAEDLWLHARGVPGAHVVIKFDGRTIPDAVIEQAASLAAYYSASRGEGRVLVDVTRVRYVKKIKGGAPGMVTYRNETPRSVEPRSEKQLDL